MSEPQRLYAHGQAYSRPLNFIKAFVSGLHAGNVKSGSSLALQAPSWRSTTHPRMLHRSSFDSISLLAASCVTGILRCRRPRGDSSWRHPTRRVAEHEAQHVAPALTTLLSHSTLTALSALQNRRPEEGPCRWRLLPVGVCIRTRPPACSPSVLYYSIPRSRCVSLSTLFCAFVLLSFPVVLHSSLIEEKHTSAAGRLTIISVEPQEK
jgi:hypothetical protein